MHHYSGRLIISEHLLCFLLYAAYLEAKKNFNIIVVDWSEGSMRFYTRAKATVFLVADIVADFVDRLVKENGMNLDDLHIIGHSLGAHVSGLAGARIKAGKPARVTGNSF